MGSLMGRRLGHLRLWLRHDEKSAIWSRRFLQIRSGGLMSQAKARREREVGWRAMAKMPNDGNPREERKWQVGESKRKNNFSANGRPLSFPLSLALSLSRSDLCAPSTFSSTCFGGQTSLRTAHPTGFPFDLAQIRSAVFSGIVRLSRRLQNRRDRWNLREQARRKQGLSLLLRSGSKPEGAASLPSLSRLDWSRDWPVAASWLVFMVLRAPLANSEACACEKRKRERTTVLLPRLFCASTHRALALLAFAIVLVQFLLE